MEKNGRFQAQKHQMPQNQYIMPGKEVEKRRNQGKKHQRQQISPTMSELEGQPIEPTISEKEVKNWRYEEKKHQLLQNEPLMSDQEVEKRRNMNKNTRGSKMSPPCPEWRGRKMEPTISQMEEQKK